MSMTKLRFSVLAALCVGCLVLPSQLVFSQETDQPHPEVPPAGDALQVTLGRDSPNLGGNVFRDAFLPFTLSNAPGIATGKIISDISFPSSEAIAFDRADLTPDVEAAGHPWRLEVDQGVEAAEPAAQGARRSHRCRGCSWDRPWGPAAAVSAVASASALTSASGPAGR